MAEPADFSVGGTNNPAAQPAQPQPQTQGPPSAQQPNFGPSGQFATNRSEDVTNDLVRNKLGALTLYTDPASRRRVYRERALLQQTISSRADVFEMLESTGQINVGRMSDEEVESVLAIVTTGETLPEIFSAISEEQTLAEDLRFMEEYNKSSWFLEFEKTPGGFGDGMFFGSKGLLDQLGNGLTQGTRQREMWNSLTPDQRMRLTKQHGLVAPSIGRSMNIDDESSEFLGRAEAYTTNVLSLAWTIPKAVIAVFDGAWRGGNRLYRGMVRQEELSGESQSPMIDAGLTGLLGTYGEGYREPLRWLDALLTPSRWGGEGGYWNAASANGEEDFLPSVVNETVDKYALDELSTEMATGLATYLDSSLFGNPADLVDVPDNVLPDTLNRMGATLAAFAGVETADAATANEREVQALEANYNEAVTEYLLDKIPGSSIEAGQARTAARTLLLESQTLRVASAELAMRGKISFGRQQALSLGHTPGTPEYQRAAGIADVFNNLFMDPMIVGGKLKSGTMMARGLSRSNSIRNIDRMQEVFDGVVRGPGGFLIGTRRTDTGFRRSVESVAESVTETLNGQLALPNILDDIEQTSLAEVAARGDFKDNGFDRIAREQPRYEPHYQQIVEYVRERLDEGIELHGRDALIDPSTGKMRGEIEGQLVVDWMKTSEGMNALVNGRLGGILSKSSNLPTKGLLNEVWSNFKEANADALDRLDDRPREMARQMQEQGAFYDNGRQVVKQTLGRLRSSGDINPKMYDDLAEQLDALEPGQRLPQPLVNDIQKVVDSKLESIRPKGLDDAVQKSSPWMDLEILSSGLSRGRALDTIGLNATGILGSPNLRKTIRTIRAMRSGDITAIKRAGLIAGELAWAPAQTTASLIRSRSILAPSNVLRFADGKGLTTLRNFGALLPSDMRAAVSNIYSYGTTETERLNIARTLMLESMDQMGIPYTTKGREFLAENVKFFDVAYANRYSASDATNFIEVNGRKVSAAVLESQLAEGMALPDFRKLLDLQYRFSKLDDLNPMVAANSNLVDIAMANVWAPANLLRLGFGVRTSIDEVAGHIARDGFFGYLKGRLAVSALSSEKSVIPYMMRPDRIALRSVLYGINGASGLGSSKWKLALAKALDVDEEVVTTLERMASGVADKSTEPVDAALRAVTSAIHRGNPYEVLSVGLTGAAIETLDWLRKQPFVTNNFEESSSLFLSARNAAVSNRRGFFEWGPAKVREMVRLAQLAVTPDDILRSTRFMLAHSDTRTAHLPSYNEMLATTNRSSYNNQHDFKYGEGPAFSNSGVRPDPTSRIHDVVFDGYALSEIDGSPESIRRYAEMLETNFGDRFFDVAARTALSDLGRDLEADRIGVEEFRATLADTIFDTIKDDPDLLDTFSSRFQRARDTRKGQKVVGRNQADYEAMAESAHSVAAEVEFRRNYNQWLRDGKQGSPPRVDVEDPATAAGGLREQIQSWLLDEGWNFTHWTGRSGEGVPLGRANYADKHIDINEDAIEEFYGRMLGKLEERRALAESEDGIPEGWDAEWGTDYVNEMGINPFDVYQWYIDNGGVEALKEKVYWHEAAHAWMHSNWEAEGLSRLAVETQAEQFAYAMMGMPFGDTADVLAGAHRTFSVLEGVEQMRVDRIRDTLNNNFGGLGSLVDDPTDGRMIRQAVGDLEEMFSSVLAETSDDLQASSDAFMRILSEEDVDPDILFSLYDSMLRDGQFAAKHPEVLERTETSLVDVWRDNASALESQAVEPITPELVDALTTYIEHLKVGLSGVDDTITSADDLIAAFDDRHIIDVAQMYAQDGLDLVDDDVLRRAEEMYFPEGDAPFDINRGNPARQETAGAPEMDDEYLESLFRREPDDEQSIEVIDQQREPLPPPPDEPPPLDDVDVSIEPKRKRYDHMSELARLSQEMSLGRVVSPDDALRDYSKTLVEHLENTLFSSSDSVARDMANGSYTPPPGQTMYVVERAPDGTVDGLRPATREDLMLGDATTEYVEAATGTTPGGKPSATGPDAAKLHATLTDPDAKFEAAKRGFESLYDELDPNVAAAIRAWKKGGATWSDNAEENLTLLRQLVDSGDFEAPELWRGVAASAKHPDPTSQAADIDFGALSVGDEIDLDVSSWSSSKTDARRFSDGPVLRVEGARAVPIPGEDEWLASGNFRVTSVEPGAVKDEVIVTVTPAPADLVLDERAIFAKPITREERALAEETIDMLIEQLQSSMNPSDPAVMDFMAMAPQNSHEIYKYAAYAMNKNDGEIDEFLETLLEAVSDLDTKAKENMRPIVERLIRGAGSDGLQRRRFVGTVDRLNELRDKVRAGEHLADKETLAELASRTQLLPDRTYGSQWRRKRRNPFEEFFDMGFSEWLLPVIDWGTRQPMLAIHFNEGVGIVKNDLMRNRPDMQRLLDVVDGSDKYVAAAKGDRVTQYGRNGYVSVKEIKKDLPTLTSRAKNLEPGQASLHARKTGDAPVGDLNVLLDQAELDPAIRQSPEGEWFVDEFLPVLMDVVPVKRADNTITETFDVWLDRALASLEETEHAIVDGGMTKAYTHMANYTDNDSVSSLFATRFRNVFPFYWAEERFLKRFIQTAAYNPAGFQRANLTVRGLWNSTILDEDDQGNKVFTYIGSEWTANLLHDMIGSFGDERTLFRVPAGVSEMTGRWDYVTPSASGEGGAPNRGGPVVSIPATTLAILLPELQGVINKTLGDYDTDPDRPMWERLFPPTVAKAYYAMSPEKIQELHAENVINAMAYMHNAGIAPPLDADPDVRRDYILAVEEWTKVLAWQSVAYGFAGVTTPKIEVAAGSPQAKFRDYISNYGFDGGLVQFMRDYPDTTLFSLFETESVGGAPMPASVETFQFLTENEDIGRNYPNAIGYMMPSAEYNNEFYRPAWARMNEYGVRRSRFGTDPEDYISNILTELEFQAAAPEYFAKRDAFDAAFDAAPERSELRKDLKEQWRKDQADMFKRAPRFEIELTQVETVDRKVALLQVRNLMEKAEAGDEKVLSLLEGNERMRKTFELTQAYDEYLEVHVAVERMGQGKVGSNVRASNKQLFIEMGQSMVEDDPNMLSYWERIILPEFENIGIDEARNILAGLES